MVKKKSEAVDSITSTTRRGTPAALALRPIRASLCLVRRARGEHEGAARLCAEMTIAASLLVRVRYGLGVELGLGWRAGDRTTDGC